jgi:hypothetical protein
MKYKLYISMLLLSSTIFSVEDKELIFIYNAKSGLVNEMIDFAHKIVSPRTYDCNLFAMSYGTFTKKKDGQTILILYQSNRHLHIKIRSRLWKKS